MNTKEITLAELGPTLPIGVSDSKGEIHRELIHRPWRMKEEKEIGALRDKNRNANLAEWVSIVLSTMYTRIGSYDFEAMKLPERRLVISKMFVGDVFYAYAYLRRVSLDKIVYLNLICPFCRTTTEDFPADLDTARVLTVDKPSQALWICELTSPMLIRGKQVSYLLLGPPTWSALEGLKGGYNTGAAKEAMIWSAVKSVSDKPIDLEDWQEVALAPHELEDLSKLDLEMITSMLDAQHVGIDMSVEEICSGCNTIFKNSIDWSYDRFFGGSLRSRKNQR